MAALAEALVVPPVPPSRSSLRVALAVGATVAILGAGGGAVLLEHPAAELGVRVTRGGQFSTVDEHASAYRTHVTQRFRSDDGAITLATTSVAYANGTVLRVVDVSATSPSLLPSNASHVETVTFGDETGLRYQEYRPGVDPKRILPHHLVRGNRTYGRISFGSATLDPFVHRVLAALVYAHTGTVTRDGETYERYEVIGHRGGLPSLFEHRYGGFVLVDDAGVVRYARIDSPPGVPAIEYRATPGATRPLPDWVETARSVPPAGANASDDRPEARAYRIPGGVAIVADGPWTPPADATATVVFAGGRTRTVELDASRSVFRRYRNDTYRVFFVPTESGLSRTGELPERRSPTDGEPRRVVVDWHGLNYYDLEVRSTRSLARIVYTLPARLRPANGGGRVIRVAAVHVGSDADASTPVTFVVGNATTSRSVTTTVGSLSLERFYLVRTRTGLAVVNDPGLAPASFSPPVEISPRRFAANATLTVAVDGVPVLRWDLPTRITRASEVPLSRLATGISLRTFANASAAPHFEADETAARTWDGYTLVKLHNWNYRSVVLSGADSDDRSGCPIDHTCYYRVSDGARVRVTTANGSVLFEGRVEGNSTIAP